MSDTFKSGSDNVIGSPLAAKPAATTTDKPEVLKAVHTDVVRPASVRIFNDEYVGKGGSYVIDPKTGKRVPKKA
jgi:hypothetical protein